MRNDSIGSAGSHGPALPRCFRPGVGLLAGLLVLIAVGCAPDIRWRTYVYDVGADEARRENRPMFVYLRNWYQPECTAFEDNTLRTQPVVDAVAPFYAVFLEADWAKHLMERWSLKRAPAVAVLSPGGELVSASDRLRTQADLLAFLTDARKQLQLNGAASRPSDP